MSKVISPNQFSKLTRLSGKEWQVFKLAATGSNKIAIANALGVEQSLISEILDSAYAKLELHRGRPGFRFDRKRYYEVGLQAFERKLVSHSEYKEIDEQITGDSQTILRSIEFPPEYKQAGIAILSYFSEIVNSKYPDLDVSIIIEQHGNKVILIITTPDGERERIEQELEKYALAIQGKLPLDDFLSSPIKVLALTNKLEIANLEIRQTRELMYSERRHYEARISTLEQNVQHLGLLIAHNYSANSELVAIIRELSKQASATTQVSFDTILEVIDRGFTSEDKYTVLEALKNIQNQNKPLFQTLSEFITSSAASGAIGNSFHEWLKETVLVLKSLIPQ